MSEIQLARQPIFKVDLKVYAYELLFRRAGTSEANVIDGDHATSRVLLNTFVEMNTEQVIGEFPAFINITENMLRSGAVKILPHDRVVLEILEDVNPDEEIIKSVKELSKLGFKIALDDFVWGSEWVPLIEIADYIKIDIMAMERPEVEELVEQLKPYNCRLLAEKIESHDEFEWCRDLGFELFQGYFLSKPRNVVGRAIPANRAVVMQLLGKINEPDVKIPELESIILQDVGMSYRLLKIINSSYYNLSRNVESIRETLMLLGLRFTRMWVGVIAMASADDKPSEIFTNAMVRAKMCELLARYTREPNSEPFFLAGLFSSLDAIMDKPMEEVLAELPISDDLKAAVLNREGKM
ncbi:MAG TPA: HDOD domain-containing protein, partial [Sneathiellales bacterium]|nr:HDOD domain-containing protein [Sneathiellales bacterium]